MHNLQTDAKATTKPPMDISQELFELADKTTKVYKDYVRVAEVFMQCSKPSRFTTKIHRKIEYSAKLGSRKGRKKSMAKKMWIVK